MSPQSFLPVNNNNNNTNNGKSTSISSAPSRNVASSSIGVTVGESTSSRLEHPDLKRKLNVASPETMSTKTSLSSSTSSLMSALEKSPATSFKLETTPTPIQSQSLMQSASMSVKCKRLPDYRRLEPSHIFNPLQVSIKKIERSYTIWFVKYFWFWVQLYLQSSGSQPFRIRGTLPWLENKLGAQVATIYLQL